MSEGTVVETPKSLDEVISGLKGFGIEEFEEILTLEAGGRVVKIRISNIPSEAEIESLLAVENAKGYLWVQKVKCEILSRAISWIDGVSLRNLKGSERLTVDPTDENGVQKDIQVVLRNILFGWGLEALTALWKVVCVHSQKIEDRYYKAFPDTAIMTEFEKRFLARALEDLEDTNRGILNAQISELDQNLREQAEADAAKPEEPKTE